MTTEELAAQKAAEDKAAADKATADAAAAQKAADEKAAADKAVADKAAADKAAADAANHNRAPGAHAFRVNGGQVSDYSAVQAHIDTLEGFQTETVKTAREEFVKNLAATNRIGAPQVDSLTEVALGMSAEQFTKFKESYGIAEGSPLFGQHSVQSGGKPGGADAKADQIDILEGQVKMHRQAGMTQVNLEKTESFKKLQTLKAQG